jgi:hypothetical protein
MRLSEILEGTAYESPASTPEVGYHVALAKNRDSIRHEGIRPTRNGWAYVWEDEVMAEWFRLFQWDDRNEGRDIYRVDLRGLVLKRDPETEDMTQWDSAFTDDQLLHQFEEDGGVWMVKGGIPPERITGIRENGYPLFDVF